MSKNNLAVERMAKVRGGNKSWTVVLDGTLIGLIEEIKETGEVIGHYIDNPKAQYQRSTKCGPFNGKSIGERTGRAAGYIMAKTGN